MPRLQLVLALFLGCGAIASAQRQSCRKAARYEETNWGHIHEFEDRRNVGLRELTGFVRWSGNDDPFEGALLEVFDYRETEDFYRESKGWIRRSACVTGTTGRFHF